LLLIMVYGKIEDIELFVGCLLGVNST
jgi:hypothetical protein